MPKLTPHETETESCNYISRMAPGLSLIVFLAMTTAPPFSKAFEIASSTPESGAVAAEAGGDLELWCNADGWWEWCKFVHESSGKNCDLRESPRL